MQVLKSLYRIYISSGIMDNKIFFKSDFNIWWLGVAHMPKGCLEPESIGDGGHSYFVIRFLIVSARWSF